MPIPQGFPKSFRRLSLALVPAILLVSIGYAQEQLQVQPPAGVGNFHVVNEHIYRGAQPSAEGFQALAKMGVKTVIDLREADQAAGEKVMVEAAGMKFISVPMRGMEKPSLASVERALSVLNDKDAGKVFVHCRRGADRTGTVVACYRISHDHWDNGRALSEAKSNGMAWIQKAMQHFVKSYRPTMEAANTAVPGTVN
jgi:protein tyrosine/serine phosphatase